MPVPGPIEDKLNELIALWDDLEAKMGELLVADGEYLDLVAARDAAYATDQAALVTAQETATEAEVDLASKRAEIAAAITVEIAEVDERDEVGAPAQNLVIAGLVDEALTLATALTDANAAVSAAEATRNSNLIANDQLITDKNTEITTLEAQKDALVAILATTRAAYLVLLAGWSP